jgi:coenzyme F420-reducing hydrogenase beta subunit
MPEVFGVKNKDADVVKNSTSGGVFTVLSDAVLDKGGVIFGAKYDENLRVIHAAAKTKDERDKFRGSKYVKSYLGKSFSEVRELLAAGRYVMFSGTPCEIDALNIYLRKNGVSDDKLITVDFVCHGTPSAGIFASYIDYIEKKTGKKAAGYNFRSKAKGWGTIIQEIIYTDGTSETDSELSRIFYDLFSDSIILRQTCCECKYTDIKRVSDLTMADFWGIEREHPDFADKRGVSMLLVNSEKGQKLWDSVKEQTLFIKSTEEAALRCHRNLSKPFENHKKSRKFKRIYEEKGFAEAIARVKPFTVSERLKRRLKNIKQASACRLSRARH